MDSLLILKAGGEALEQAAMRQAVLNGLAAWQGPRILVHGGGKKGAEVAARLGVETEMHQGRRITSPEMLEVAAMVYGGLLNKGLVAELAAMGLLPLGVCGADLDLVRATKRPAAPIDFGEVGDVTAVHADRWQDLLDRRITPVLAPLTHDGAGCLLNTNADTMACAVSAALASRYDIHLVFAFDQPGVLRTLGDPQSLIREITSAGYSELQAQGAVGGGMKPKLDNAFAALNAGARRVYLCAPAALTHLGAADFVGTAILPS